MSKNAKTKARVTGVSVPTDWMEILRLNKKKFMVLSKKVNLQHVADYPIPDPVQRLSVTLRYLVTGEGYNDLPSEIWEESFDTIFLALRDSMEVNIVTGSCKSLSHSYPSFYSGLRLLMNGNGSPAPFSGIGKCPTAWVQ